MHKRRFSFSLITIFAENPQFHSRNDDSSNRFGTEGGGEKEKEKRGGKEREKKKKTFARNTSLTLQIRVVRRISVSQDGSWSLLFFFN